MVDVVPCQILANINFITDASSEDVMASFTAWSISQPYYKCLSSVRKQRLIQLLVIPLAKSAITLNMLNGTLNFIYHAIAVCFYFLSRLFAKHTRAGLHIWKTTIIHVDCAAQSGKWQHNSNVLLRWFRYTVELTQAQYCNASRLHDTMRLPYTVCLCISLACIT